MLNKIYQSIPLYRLLGYLMIPALLPLLWISFHYWTATREWKNLASHLEAVQHQSAIKAQKQRLNNLIRKTYADADHFYIDHQLETMSFLKKEKEGLEALFQNRAYTGNDAAEQRYAFITGEKNRFLMTQGNIQTAENIRQSTEVLSHSVELSFSDLDELLSRIEEKQPGQPQLLITHLRLNRKQIATGGEVFETQLKLLKREFES